LDKIVEQVRSNPALCSKQVRNEAIRRDYWDAIRQGQGYCQAAESTAKKYGVDSKTVYRARVLTVKKIGK